MSNTNKDFKDVAKKEVAQATHEVKGELTYWWNILGFM